MSCLNDKAYNYILLFLLMYSHATVNNVVQVICGVQHKNVCSCRPIHTIGCLVLRFTFKINVLLIFIARQHTAADARY